MMVILNPTDYEIVVKWDGQNHHIEPDQRKQIDNDSMGKQIMHNYRARGLVDLYYGDEGDIELKKIKEGREICDKFWTKQCINYNQDNERRQQTQRPFVKPQDEVLLHAQRLGIKLLEPYKLEDTSSKQISLLMEQNKTLEKELTKKDTAMVGLQSQVSELTENFKKLMTLAGGEPAKTEAAPADNGDAKYDELKATVIKMPKKRFANWLVKNWTEIQSYPDDVIENIAAKHESLFDKTMPKEQPVIDNYNV
jgi:hypothetical protein